MFLVWTAQRVRTKKENRYLLDPAFAANASQLISNSSGATLALLMSASDMVVSQGHTPATKCPDGSGYCATWQCDFQCTEGFAGYDPATMEPVDGFNVGVLNTRDCSIQACIDDEDCENLGEDENGRYWCLTTGCCEQIYVE